MMKSSAVLCAVAVPLVLATLGVTSTGAADPLRSLRFLAGTWTCAYQAGTTRATYQATFAYTMGGNWMREFDAWAGGGGDEALIAYEPKLRRWTEAVFEADRSTTIFRANGSDARHIVFHSVLPDSSYTDVFDKLSPVKYTLHFTQAAGGKTTTSFDTCSKNTRS